MIISFTILGLIFYANNIEEYVYLSLNALVSKYTFYTLIKSLFIDPINIFNPFFMFTIILIFIMLFFTYMIARIIEMSKGTKFLFQLFFFSGIFSIIFYFLFSEAVDMVEILEVDMPEGTVLNNLVGRAFEVVEIEFDLGLEIDKDSEKCYNNLGIHCYNQFVPAFFLPNYHPLSYFHW